MAKKKVTPLKRFYDAYDKNEGVVIAEFSEGSDALQDNFLSIYIPDPQTGRTLCLEVAEMGKELTAILYLGDKKVNIEYDNVKALTAFHE